MKSALVTGANKSIGFEVVRQLAKTGIYVYLGSRNFEKGIEAEDKLRAEGLNNVEAIQLDITSDESVKNARTEIGKRTKTLDILINNAGIYGGYPQAALNASIDQFKAAYDANVYGVVRVTQAFIDLLEKSDEPRIVNVSSSQGSITLHSDPSYKYYDYKGAVYLSSKSAMNMYTVVLAYELKDSNFKINAVLSRIYQDRFQWTSWPRQRGRCGTTHYKVCFNRQRWPYGKIF